MDDSLANETADHPTQQINEIISKIQTLRNFNNLDNTIFDSIRSDFVSLPSYIVKEISQRSTAFIMGVTVEFIKYINYQSQDTNQKLFLQNILSLLSLMNFRIPKNNSINIDDTFFTFSSFFRKCERSLYAIILNVFYHILDDNYNEDDQLRQKFLKYFIPSFGYCLKSFSPFFTSETGLQETTFFMQLIEFLLRLSANTYIEIRGEVDQLLSTLLQFLNVSPKNCPNIKNLENILLIQAKIIKVFITYCQLSLPIQGFKIDVLIPCLLNILANVDPSYFYTVRVILHDFLLIMNFLPENLQTLIQLLNCLPLFCQFNRYNQHLVDTYTVFVFQLYEKSSKASLITDQIRIHLFLFMMNILHYQGVQSFIRHNEFSQLQQHIPMKGLILFLYNYSFDVDFNKSIQIILKHSLENYDMDSLFKAYNKSLYIGESIYKIFKSLTNNMQIVVEKFRSDTPSLLCEVTSKFNIYYINMHIITLCDAILFVAHYQHLLNKLSKVDLDVSKSTTIDDFYDKETKMISILSIAEKCEKIYNSLLNELVNIYCIIPMYYVSNILDIFLKKMFSQNEISLEKTFITTFCQKCSTMISFIDSYFSFVIPHFQSYENLQQMFSVSMFLFQNLNEMEIEYSVPSQYQKLLQDHALKLICTLKENYVNSTKYASDALQLISHIVTFVDKFIGNCDFSSNLINNNYFLREICRSARLISISPVDSLGFIDFCSSVFDKSLTFPYVVELLILSLESNPELAIPLLNKATKICKKAVYNHSMSILLFQTSAYLLDKTENPNNKRILLKFLKHSTSNFNSDIIKVPNDIYSLKKLFFQNKSENISFSFPLLLFIEQLKKTMNQSPKNDLLYEMLAETVISIFALDDLSFDNRKMIFELLNFLFSFYENEPDHVTMCYKSILKLSVNNYAVYAHLLASLCSCFQKPPTSFIFDVVSIIQTLQDFETLVKEIGIISYLNLLPSKSVLESLLFILIENISSDLINPISLALLFYDHISSNSISLGLIHEYKSDGLTTFSELGYLSRRQIEIIVLIRDLIGKSTLSISPILSIIPSLTIFPQIVLFEFISLRECNEEVLSFFQKCLDSNSIDNLLKSRLVGLVLRAFPKLIEMKSDQILDILATLESTNLASSSPQSSSISSPSSSMTLLPSFFAASSATSTSTTSSTVMTFSSGSIERQQEGNILLILNAILQTKSSLISNPANYINLVNKYLTSNNLFYRHQARIAILNLFKIRNNEIDFSINMEYKEYMRRINFPEDIYESTFIDFSACYEYLMVFFPIYHNNIFLTITKYLKQIEINFSSKDYNHFKKFDKQKINQDIFIKSLLSLFSFFSNDTIIELLVSEGYMIKLLPYISFIYCTFIFQRNRIFDEYVLKMLEKAAEQFVEYLNTSSINQHCLDFFVIFLENEKAFNIIKKYEDKITLTFNNEFKDKMSPSYYLSLSAILTYFNKSTDDVQKSMFNQIDLFKSDARQFEPYLFSKIMKQFALKYPERFLMILFQVIKSDSPLLLAHCRLIFDDSIEYFNENMFSNLPYNEYSNFVRENFFNFIVVNYIYLKPKSLEYFINLAVKTQPPYVVASFFIFLKKKKLVKSDYEVDALELYDKCENSKSRLKVIQYWSTSSNCSNFSQMFKNLESFISIHMPIEVFMSLTNLKLPNDFKLPNSFYSKLPYFYNQESSYSPLLSLVARNSNQAKLMPAQLKQDLLMNIEFSFDSLNSKINDLYQLFETTFLMFNDIKDDEVFIHRCESYIYKILSIVKACPTSSRTFLKLILQYSFKIINLYKESESEEEDNSSLLYDEIKKFFIYILENSRSSKITQVLATYSPNLAELLVENDDEAEAENLLSQIVDLDNQYFWPSVMKALNKLSKFDSIYDRIAKFRSTSLVFHSLPIIWKSSNEKTYQQIKNTLDLCSSKPKSRADAMLQNICMIYMTNNLQTNSSQYLVKCIDDNQELTYKILKFVLNSNNDKLINILSPFLENKKIIKIYYNKNGNKIEENVVSLLSPTALINSCNLFIDQYPSYVEKAIASLPNNYIVKISKMFSSLFNYPIIDCIPLINNIEKKLKVGTSFNEDANVEIENNNRHQKDNLDIQNLLDEPSTFHFGYSPISLKASLDCLENLSYWNESKIEVCPEFSCSNESILPLAIFYSHFSLKKKAQNAINFAIDNPKVSVGQIEKIINEINYDSFLKYIKEKINDSETVLKELTNVLNKMQIITNSDNFLNYLIFHSLKCPLEMINNGSTTFPPHAFELKLSPTILPKYHQLYSKVRNAFIESFSSLKQIDSSNENENKSNSSDNKLLQNLFNKFKTIHEKHLFEENLSLVNFNGDELKYNTQERDIERIITGVFFSSFKSDPDEMVEAAISTLEKGLKLNPFNDVFITALAFKCGEIDNEKYEGLLNLIKSIPFKWNPTFIDLIANDEENVYKCLLPKVHKGFCLNLINKKVNVSDGIKKLAKNYLIPLIRCTKIFESKSVSSSLKVEEEVLQVLRKKNYTKKNIPQDIRRIILKQRDHQLEDMENEEEKNENEEEEENSNNESNDKKETENEINDEFEDVFGNDSVEDDSNTFFLKIDLPSIPPLLTEETSNAICLSGYFKKSDDKFITITLTLSNGSSINYILAPILINSDFSLFSSLISKVLKFDQQCSLKGQIIESLISAEIGNNFSLINANESEPLYRSILTKKLYYGTKEFLAEEDKKPKYKPSNQTNVLPLNDNKFFYNFSSNESYFKWFYFFGTRYAALSLLQSFLNIPTPSPSDVMINLKNSTAAFSKLDTEFCSINSRYSNFRMCGKMKKFLSKFVLNGPFKDGLISAATCLVDNQYKVSLFIDSIFDKCKKDPFAFIKKCAGLSLHNSSSPAIQENTSFLIEKSYNDDKIFIIPWL